MKTYEKFKSSDDYNVKSTSSNTPKLNDYVICHMKQSPYSVETQQQFRDFVNNNIGYIIYLTTHKLITQYENIPEEIQSYFTYNEGTATHLYLPDIKYWSNKKEELEHIINSNKYNL